MKKHHKKSWFRKYGIILFFLGLFFFIFTSSVSAADIFQKTLGDDNAQITMEAFLDFDEPFTLVWYERTFQEIKNNYVDTSKLKLIIKHFPINLGCDEDYEDCSSFEPNDVSIALECSAEQDKFFEYIELLSKNHPSDKITEYGECKKEGRENCEKILEDYANNLNLDINKFNNCYNEEETLQIIGEDIEEAREIGFRGVPVFIINRCLQISGAQSYEQFTKVFEEVLEKGENLECDLDEEESPSPQEQIDELKENISDIKEQVDTNTKKFLDIQKQVENNTREIIILKPKVDENKGLIEKIINFLKEMFVFGVENE